MLPEIGLTEYLVIAIVALIVVGPKELPVMMRKLGQFASRMRAMASEFRASFDEMARQSELDELRKEVEAMRRGQFGEVAKQAGETELRQTVDEIEQSLSDVGVQLHPPMSYQYSEPPEPLEPEPVKTPRKPRAAKPKPEDAAAAPKPARKPRAKKIVEGGPS